MIFVEVTLLDGCSGWLVPEEVADHASKALTNNKKRLKQVVL
jgi:hypothetical protein